MNLGIPANASTGKRNFVFIFSEKILHRPNNINCTVSLSKVVGRGFTQFSIYVTRMAGH